MPPPRNVTGLPLGLSAPHAMITTKNRVLPEARKPLCNGHVSAKQWCETDRHTVTGTCQAPGNRVSGTTEGFQLSAFERRKDAKGDMARPAWSEPRREKPPLTTARLLVVDDDREIRELVSHFLEKHGYVVETVRDGREMNVALTRNDVDLIILDIM